MFMYCNGRRQSIFNYASNDGNNDYVRLAYMGQFGTSNFENQPFNLSDMIAFIISHQCLPGLQEEMWHQWSGNA